jgi:hypothetical protein
MFSSYESYDLANQTTIRILKQIYRPKWTDTKFEKKNIFSFQNLFSHNDQSTIAVGGRYQSE